MSVIFSESLNRGRFETWTEKPDYDFHHVKQVHGVEIIPLKSMPCDADGFVVHWNELDTPIAIKTADCMPIVIEGQHGVVFMHAGWKGLADGILNRKELKDIEPVRGFIGPSIHVCHFEVTAEFKNHFPGSEFFVERDGKLFFDLNKEATKQLKALFPHLLLESAPVCTYCNPKYHSYRRGKHKPERNWNLYIKG